MFFVQVHVVLGFNHYLFKFMNMLEFDYTPHIRYMNYSCSEDMGLQFSSKLSSVHLRHSWTVPYNLH